MTEHVDRLSKAGWHEGRSVDHRPALDRLESEGHLLADWFPSVVSEFDGLALSFNRNGRDNQVVLEPAEAGRRWYPATIASYADRVGCSLLQNYVDQLFKHANQPGRIGDGTTMAALPSELAAGAGPHIQKATEIRNGLSRWLTTSAGQNASAADRAIAQDLFDQLDELLP